MLDGAVGCHPVRFSFAAARLDLRPWGVTIRPLDHTADLGYDIVASTRAEIYAEAARAFVQSVTDPEQVRSVTRDEVRVEAADDELLLVEWLDELLYRFDTQGWLPAEVDVDVEDGNAVVVLVARMSGEPFDPSRHELRVPIKAVTLHGLAVRHDGAVWRARIIFDI